MKKSLLFVNQAQFGYHIDYFQYCIYLKEEFNITYLCQDYKKDKIEEPGIKILYIPRDGNLLIRNFRFIKAILKSINKERYSIIFVHYFNGSSLIPILNKNRQKLHLDIRTGNVSPNIIYRNVDNLTIFIESLAYKSISIISEGLRKKLFINKTAYILPLGANFVVVRRRSTHFLHLLYVGTLTNRRLEDTIDGFNLFLKKNPDSDIHYTIIGDGWFNEKQYLQSTIIKLGLQDKIDITGYVPHKKLMKFYEIANVGVSYIPITSYYKFQPATKTFEYLMAGIPVLATQTYENKQVINRDNGILINDTPDSFAMGITHFYNHIKTFSEINIRESVENYTWQNIIQKMKENFLS